MHGEIIRGNFLAQQAPERRLNFCRNGGSIQNGMVAQLVRTRCPTNPGIFKYDEAKNQTNNRKLHILIQFYSRSQERFTLVLTKTLHSFSSEFYTCSHQNFTLVLIKTLHSVSLPLYTSGPHICQRKTVEQQTGRPSTYGIGEDHRASSASEQEE